MLSEIRPAIVSTVLFTVLLGRNLLLYGIGGIIVPFIGIKLIDLIVNGIDLA